MLSLVHVHRLLHDRRGPAKAHACIACGGPAADWAYQHNAEAAEGRDRHGSPYSEDLGHYAPMCRRCHIQLDGTKAERMAADPAFAERMRAAGRQAGQLNAARIKEDPEHAAKIREVGRQNGTRSMQHRRQCECGRILAPAHLGSHQKASGHSTWKAVA